MVNELVLKWLQRAQHESTMLRIDAAVHAIYVETSVGKCDGAGWMPWYFNCMKMCVPSEYLIEYAGVSCFIIVSLCNQAYSSFEIKALVPSNFNRSQFASCDESNEIFKGYNPNSR